MNIAGFRHSPMTSWLCFRRPWKTGPDVPRWSMNCGTSFEGGMVEPNEWTVCGWWMNGLRNTRSSRQHWQDGIQKNPVGEDLDWWLPDEGDSKDVCPCSNQKNIFVEKVCAITVCERILTSISSRVIRRRIVGTIRLTKEKKMKTFALLLVKGKK